MTDPYPMPLQALLMPATSSFHNPGPSSFPSNPDRFPPFPSAARSARLCLSTATSNIRYTPRGPPAPWCTDHPAPVDLIFIPPHQPPASVPDSHPAPPSLRPVMPASSMTDAHSAPPRPPFRPAPSRCSPSQPGPGWTGRERGLPCGGRPGAPAPFSSHTPPPPEPIHDILSSLSLCFPSRCFSDVVGQFAAVCTRSVLCLFEVTRTPLHVQLYHTAFLSFSSGPCFACERTG